MRERERRAGGQNRTGDLQLVEASESMDNTHLVSIEVATFSVPVKSSGDGAQATVREN